MSQEKGKGATMWGGRFASPNDPLFARFNRSTHFDQRLFVVDVRGSIAWANALGHARVLSQREVSKLRKGLQAVGKAGIDPAEIDSHEDVHSLVEHRLGEQVGELAHKLHTGRSRNDQVATDLKLWLREQVDGLVTAVHDLIAALVELAEQHADLPLCGYTHLQRAQPITVGHHALAYAEMLGRDRGRLLDALKRLDTCPLGSGALAGTAFPIDRRALARELDFTGGPTRNSLDAVSDRDHNLEVTFACVTIALHLSRLAEDWVFFASQETGFLELDDAVATGSSLMPQKKNPDALELIRGKTGRVLGALQAQAVTLKGLPLAYNKDMQEDKEALFDAIDTTRDCLHVMALVVRRARFDPDRCRQAAATGHTTATDVADLLVAHGVPFRTAHERTGTAVRRALELGVEIAELPLAEQERLLPEIAGRLDVELHVERVLARRHTSGGTAPSRVRAEVRSWQQRLAKWSGAPRAASR